MSQQRGPWFLLTGLALGLVLGVAFAWFVMPIQYVDIQPADLSPAAQDSYRSFIALSFQSTGNLERARQRLALLKEGGSPAALASQAQRIVAAGSSTAPEARALAFLASALGPKVPTATPTQNPQASPTPKPVSAAGSVTSTLKGAGATLNPALAIRTATPLPSATPTLTPTATLTPQFTFTPRPTRRPSPTLGAPFTLKSRSQVCDPSLTQPLLAVDVFNSAGQGVPGVRIVVTWDGGTDSFYTGLMPDSGPGHADFIMDPAAIYSIQAGEGGVPATGLKSPSCRAGDGSTYPGSWKLVFSQ